MSLLPGATLAERQGGDDPGGVLVQRPQSERGRDLGACVAAEADEEAEAQHGRAPEGTLLAAGRAVGSGVAHATG